MSTREELIPSEPTIEQPRCSTIESTVNPLERIQHIKASNGILKRLAERQEEKQFLDERGTAKKKDVLEKEITEVIERKESSDKAQLLKLEGWGKIIKKHPYILITSLYAIAMVFIYLLMTREGFYPWGSDTWGHLFKGHFLYKEFVKG